ncbi:hypothetical protein NA57DRAFT_61782 [Rhizodiscina lignyota]|uniref:Uncharacterized protein n=1 Tax=Rhizodiscina lignyota TaxID=1504668 RepID=A0A9P4I3W7_9PEZI|nr:hypothetical protein NA57DRAFT_61782 [Rhizodiscina lignyota]
MWAPIRSLIGLICFGLAVDAQGGAPSAAAKNPCANCSVSFDTYQGGWWTSHSPTATIEAATVLVIQNNRTNTTRTTTIFNLPANATLPPTNSAGTIVYTKTITWDSKTITTVLAWPTGYISYQEGASWQGTIPIAPIVSGLSYQNSSHLSCSTAPPNGTFSRYPSLIPPEFPTSTRTFKDENYTAPAYQTQSFYLWEFIDTDGTHEYDVVCDSPWSVKQYDFVYPSFFPYEFCSNFLAACAATALGTVAYLTVTSTSHEDTGPTHSASPAAEHSQSSATAGGTPTSPSPKQTSTGANVGGGIASFLGAGVSKTSAAGGSSHTSASPSGSSSGSPSNGESSNNGSPSINGGSSSNDAASVNSGTASSGSSLNENSGSNSGSNSASTSKEASSNNGSNEVSNSPTYLITTNDAGETVATGNIAMTIPLTSINSGGSAQGGAGASEVSPTTPFTFTGGSITTVVTPTTDSNGSPVIVLSSTAALQVTTNSAGEQVVVLPVPATTIPLSEVPNAPTGSAAATKPFTFVSGTISEIVTPTANAAGQPVVVLFSSETLPLESVTTDGASGSSGVGGYIISGLGGGTSTATSGSSDGTKTDSTPALFTGGSGAQFAVHFWATIGVLGIVAFEIFVL